MSWWFSDWGLLALRTLSRIFALVIEDYCFYYVLLSYELSQISHPMDIPNFECRCSQLWAFQLSELGLWSTWLKMVTFKIRLIKKWLYVEQFTFSVFFWIWLADSYNCLHRVFACAKSGFCKLNGTCIWILNSFLKPN